MVNRQKESEIQADIVAALQLAKLTVFQTSAFRQKGPSGCSKGIPDLLVIVPGFKAAAVLVEVKRPGGRMSPEQKELNDAGGSIVVDNVADALWGVADLLNQFVSSSRLGNLQREDSIKRLREIAIKYGGRSRG